MDWNISLGPLDRQVVALMDTVHTRTEPHSPMRLPQLLVLLQGALARLAEESAALSSNDWAERQRKFDLSFDIKFANQLLDLLVADGHFFDRLLPRVGVPVRGADEEDAVIDTLYRFWLVTLIGERQVRVFVEHVPVWLIGPDGVHTVAPLGPSAEDPREWRRMLVSLAFAEACHDYHPDFNEIVNEVWDDDVPGAFKRAKAKLRANVLRNAGLDPDEV